MRYFRTVYLSDTDAAGVVYFANLLSMCHEAYEDSLAQTGISLRTILAEGAIAIPIVHSEIDFFRPLFYGDQLTIHLSANQINETAFETIYQVFLEKSSNKPHAKAKIRHVAIDKEQRKQIPLPQTFIAWIRVTQI